MKLVGHMISAFVIVFILGGHAYAQASEPASIRVEGAWARATPARATTGAAHVTVVNNGSATDNLQSATTPLAQKVQFHKESVESGISRMRELRTVEIDPGAKVIFEPGNLHLMMVGLKQPLKEGETFPLTLNFEKAGKVDVTVSVSKIGAMQRGGMRSMAPGADHPMKK